MIIKLQVKVLGSCWLINPPLLLWVSCSDFPLYYELEFPFGPKKQHEQGMAQWWERSPPTNVAWVRFRPFATCGLSLLFVLVLLRGFFSGFSCFPSSSKTNSLNCNSIKIEDFLENQLIFCLPAVYVERAKSGIKEQFWFLVNVTSSMAISPFSPFTIPSKITW